MKNVMKLPFTTLLSKYREYKSDLIYQVKTDDKEINMLETLYITRVYGPKEVELNIEHEVNKIMESK